LRAIVWPGQRRTLIKVLVIADARVDPTGRNEHS